MLATFWFLYFTGLGIFFPFYALYLHDDAKLDGAQVGVVLAVLPLVGMVAQPLWGQIADRTGRRVAVLVTVTTGAAIGYGALWAVSGFWGFVIGSAALALFAWAVVPVAFSVTFAALREAGPHAFGLVRVWGTIGYLIAVAAFPAVLARVGGAQGQNLQLMFPATAACVIAAALVAFALPRGGAVGVRARRGEWRALLHEGAVLRLLLFTFVAYVFLQGPMSMFPIFVRAHGGDVGTVGRMWVVMLLLEIPLVALSGAGLRRLGARGLLVLGVLAGGVRWTACALIDDVMILYAVQLLHGIVVVGLLLGGPMYLDLVVPDTLRSTAQALVAMAGPGLGSIISNTSAGWLIDHSGTNAPFLIGGIGALLLGASAVWVLPRPERR
jgi:PPP family 3-phenylpropionic acid transporter